VIVANLVLEVRGMLFQQWLILFSTACFGNLLGLNISAGMRTAVSIYILIPLILVPQLLLGGAMIKFDELPASFSKKIYVPVIGDVMATRWAYEAISVEQFKSNRYEKPLFNNEMEKSRNDWYATFLIPDLKAKADQCIRWGKDPDYRKYSESNFKKLNYHIKELSDISGINPGRWIGSVNYSGFNDIIAADSKIYFDSLKTTFRHKSRILSNRLDSIYQERKNRMGEEQYLKMRERDYNENLANIVLNRFSTSQKYDIDDRIIQKADPIFMIPVSKWGRAHFFAPYKLLGNHKIPTLLFNMAAIWIMIIGLFVTLFYNVLNRFIVWLESLKLPIWRKFGRDLLQI
jgi:hypothetical protein